MAFTVKDFGIKGQGNHMSHVDAAKYFGAAVTYLKKSELAATVYNTLEHLPNYIPVLVWDCNGDDYFSHAHAGGGLINWDPLSAMQVTEGGWQSPAVALIHEMYHAYQEYVLKDIYPNMPQKLVSTGPGTGKAAVSKEEVDTVVFEGKVCKQLAALGHANETVRASYYRYIGIRPVKSPSATGG